MNKPIQFSDLTLEEQREVVAELRLFVAMLMLEEESTRRQRRARRSRRPAVSTLTTNHRLLDLLSGDTPQH